MKCRSQRLGLEMVLRPDFDCLGLGRIGKHSRLGLVSNKISNISVSSRSGKKRSRLHPCASLCGLYGVCLHKFTYGFF